MTVARPPQPSGDNFKTWGTRLNEYLVRTRSQLAQFTNTSSAINDGMLVWDAENSRVLYSNEGVWIPIAGTTDNFASLYYDGSAKITATADGVTAFGNITLSGFPESDYELKGDIDGAVRFHAVATEALSKGDVVYIVEHASSGSETKVAKALASDAAKMPAFGLALDNAAIDAAVQVVTFGNLYGSGGAGDALDTSAYNSGTPLYVSATTAGEWTGTAPTGESNLVQNIGKVVRKQQTNGVIKVGGAGRTNATPNLNDGNIFIGNSSNEAITASLATQVSTLETSHDDVLVDGDFTSNGFMKRTGAGTYAIDSNTYLTTHQDISGKADLSGATFTGTITAPNVDISTTGTVTTNIAAGNNVDGTNTKTVNIGTGYSVGLPAPLTTVNIGSQASNAPNTINIGSGTAATNTINLKGNVDIDGTLNGGVYERTVRTKFQRRGYSNFIALTNLTTTSTQVGGTIRKDAGVTYAVEHTLDLNITAQFNDINTTNDGEFVVVIYAPTPSDEATINLGTVTLATLGVAKVSGDVTKHFSAYCGLSKNSDGSNAFGFNNSDGWWYSASTNETFIYFYPYQSNTPSTGDTLYLHPFDWETLGTAVNGDTYPLDAYNASGNVHQNHFIKIELGYFKTDKTIIVRCREQSTSENIGITRISGTYTQIIGT